MDGIVSTIRYRNVGHVRLFQGVFGFRNALFSELCSRLELRENGKRIAESMRTASSGAAHFFVAECPSIALAGTQSILDCWTWRLAITDDGVRYGPTFGQACARDWRLNGHWLLPRTRMRESWLQPDRGCRRGAHRKGGSATAQCGCRSSSCRSGSRHGGGSRSALCRGRRAADRLAPGECRARTG